MIEKEFNTENWNEEDYDDFLDYLEDLDDLEDEDDENYEDEEYLDSTSIQPMQNYNQPTVYNQQNSIVQYDRNNQVGGFFNELANKGINFGISDRNGSGFVIGGNGINININPNKIMDIGNSIKKSKYKYMKNKIRKEKNKKKR